MADQSRSTYSPRYLVKRGRVVALFALSSAIAGVVQDPKFFRLLAESARTHSVTIAMLVVMLVLLLAVSFAVVQTILESRYAVRGQASVAALLFLAIFILASLLGFWGRMLLVPDAGTVPPAIGAQNLLVSTFVLALGGASAAALFSLLFTQKADYTKLRAEVRNVLSIIDGMRATFERRGYVPNADAERLAKACRASRDTAADVVKTEAAAYAVYIDVAFAQPLTILAEAAEAKSAQETPESFLRACGVVDPERASSNVATAFRMLQNRT